MGTEKLSNLQEAAQREEEVDDGFRSTQVVWSHISKSSTPFRVVFPRHCSTDITLMAKYMFTLLLNTVTPGFPDGASVKEPSCQCKRHKRCGFSPWAGKIPWRRKWQLTSVFLPRESHGQRSLAGYSPKGCKEEDTTELLRTPNVHIIMFTL